jgi:hypothetical protein
MDRAEGPRRAQATRGPVRPFAVLSFLVVVAVAIAVTTPGAARARPAPSSSPARSAAASESTPATCVVHSLPSFVGQGEFRLTATVADIVEVECNPNVYGTGSKIKITASQLYSRCKAKLTWYVPNPFAKVENTRGVTVTLDADGNATVALLAGPECAAGESLITAHMEEEPFETFTTSFTVLPPINTTPGVFALPATQVEDAGSSAVATIVQTEFPGGSEKLVRIASEELYRRCRRAPHLHWIRMDGTEPEEAEGPEVTGVELDNNGNAFVIAIGDASCAEGSSLIEADLESKPFTTFTTTFTVQPPQPTGEPSFTIEKLQEISAGTSGFTTSPLSGSIGQTVDYEIVVRNTGNVAETFSEFTDAHCDPGTIAGGPGSSPVAPGRSTTYTCDHLLTMVGSYTNQAMVTGTSTGGTPVQHTSNQVMVEVPPAPAIVPPGVGPAISQTIPGAGPSPTLMQAGPAPAQEVLAGCETSLPTLHGASGPKRTTFALQISSLGIKRITFYLDGRKLKTLAQSQAKGGKFTIKINPRNLSYGAHRVSIKTLMSNSTCASVARSGVFVRPRTQHVAPTFTG